MPQLDSTSPAIELVVGAEAIKLAALGGAAVPCVFLAGVLIAASHYDGYSHVTQKISELGGAEATSRWIQNLNFLTIGLLVLGLVWALNRVMGAPRLGVALLGYFAVSAAIGNAALPCDAGCEGETTVGLLHIITGITGFVAAIAAMFVLARRWQDDPDWQSHAAFTRAIRLVAIAGLVWFVVTQAADSEGTAGIAQRVFAGALMVWIGVTGWRLHHNVDSMAKKYMDVDAYPFHQPGDERVVNRVQPEHTTHMG